MDDDFNFDDLLEDSDDDSSDEDYLTWDDLLGGFSAEEIEEALSDDFLDALSEGFEEFIID